MKHRGTGWLLALAAAATLAASDATTEAKIMMEAARKKEVVDGDLNGAIKQYSEIVARYKNDRSVVANALVRMAECYQMMGDAEARKIFERVVRDFSDQKEASGKARTRLGTPSIPRADAMAARLAWKTSALPCCGLAADGRVLVFIDSAKRELGVHDLGTGADRALVKAGQTDPGNFGVAAISKDGKTVAYGWRQPPVRGGVRLVNVSGGEGSRTLFENADLNAVEPRDWSFDGKWIAAELRRKDRTAQIGLISVSDGSLRILKSVDWRGSRGMYFSPDGKHLAYDLPAGDNALQRDVFVLAADGSSEVAAVVDPNDDIVMGWSPDGHYLLFASDRRGSFGLFALPFAAGRPDGAPLPIKMDLPNPAPIGVAADGALYWKSWVTDANIGVVAMDLGTGKLAGQVAKPVKSFGANSFPIWSRDGKNIAYVATRGDGFSDPSLAILSLDSGRVTEVRPRLEQFIPYSWAPDGRSVAVVGPDLKGRYGIHQVDVRTGEVVPIRFDDPEDPTGFFAPEWSWDGTKLYYSAFPVRSGASALMERDLASRKDREVIRGRYFAKQASPDGRWIATSRDDGPGRRPSVVVVVPTGEGMPREIFRVDTTHMVTSFGWTPDSHAVIVGKFLSGNPNDPQLWLVPIDGGEVRKLESPANVAQVLSLSPDARQIAFTMGHFGAAREIWTLENFLPKANVRK